MDSIKSEPALYFSKAHLKKWSVIHLTAWGWYLELKVVLSVEDSLYAECAQLMDWENAKIQDAMDAERLAVPTGQGGSGGISIQEPHDLAMESRPIPTALANNPSNIMDDKPPESQEMVLLRSKKEIKEKKKLEKQRIA
jgi:hypothetical protein